MFVRLFAIKQIHEKTNDSMAIRGCLFGLLRAAVITTCWSSGCRSEMLLFQPQCIVPVDNTPPPPRVSTPHLPPKRYFTIDIYFTIYFLITTITEKELSQSTLFI